VLRAPRFSSLVFLDAGLCHMTDGQLAQVACLTSLRALALQSCEALTDAGLAHLRHHTGLTLLDLQNCCKVEIIIRKRNKPGEELGPRGGVALDPRPKFSQDLVITVNQIL